MLSFTDDLILGGRVRLRQPTDGFRSGSDAVLLAAAAHPPAGGRVLELGCGTGLPMLALAARRPDVDITGLELQPPVAALASHNVAVNGMAGRGRVCAGDVRQPPFAAGSFAMVIANPPYFDPAKSRRSGHAARDLARAGAGATLADWIAAALAMLAPGGHIVIVLRRERLAEVRQAVAGRAGIDVLPLGSVPGKPAKRVLLRLVPGGTAGIERPPLPMHRADGGETALAAAIFRDALPIDWSAPCGAPDSA